MNSVGFSSAAAEENGAMSANADSGGSRGSPFGLASVPLIIGLLLLDSLAATLSGIQVEMPTLSGLFIDGNNATLLPATV